MKTYREFNHELEERVEKLSTRLKRAKAMRKNKNKIAMARKRAAKKVKIDTVSIEKKAIKQARALLIKKKLKGASLSDLGMGQKIALSKFLDKKTAKISKIAKKLKKGIRQKEMMKKRKPPITPDQTSDSAIPLKK